MPSVQARVFNLIVRLIVKRKDWGGPQRLTQRARSIFGAPRISQWFATRDMAVTPVNENGLRGEWIEQKGEHDESIVLYIHGGGFVSCAPATHRPISAALARASHLRVFSLNYRLAPEHPFPAAVEDVLAAYQHLAEMNPESSIALAGDSAGGGLVLSTITKIRGAGLPMPSCGVCFSAWTDLTGSGGSVKTNAEQDQMFYPNTIDQFASAYIGNADKRDPLASPVFGDFDAFPPILFHVGSTELLVDDSRRPHDAIRDAGGQSVLTVYEGVSHGWQMGAGLIPEADRSLREAAQFIKQHSGRMKKQEA